MNIVHITSQYLFENIICDDGDISHTHTHAATARAVSHSPSSLCSVSLSSERKVCSVHHRFMYVLFFVFFCLFIMNLEYFVIIIISHDFRQQLKVKMDVNIRANRLLLNGLDHHDVDLQ